MEQTRILIVEDEQVVALDLQASLEGLGYAVLARVATGEAAIERAAVLHPDLVLMDIRLAGQMDGIEAAEKIRAQLDLPVIYLTAFSDELTLQRAQVSEPFGYILKPFEERELRSNIAMALYKHRLEVALRESERRFRSLFAYSSDGISLVDQAGTIVEWNEAAEDLTGLKRETVVGRPCWEVVYELLPYDQHSRAEAERSKDLFLSLLAGDPVPWQGRLLETEIQRTDGTRRIVQSRSFTFRAEGGLMAGLTLCDITERKAAEAAERDQRRLAEALCDTALALNSTLKSEEIFERILDNVGRVVPSDAATLMLLEGDIVRFVSHRGYVERGLADYLTQSKSRCADFFTVQTMRATRQPCIIPEVQSDARWMSTPGTHWVRSYLGVPVCIKGRVVGVLNLDSATSGYFTPLHAERVKAFADQAAIALENARLFERAHQLSITDTLTGLHNRRHFFSLAEAELARARRYGHSVAAVMIDVDHFKVVNDTHGHVVGDAVLRQVARRMYGQLRAADILGRYGGEEFVALLPETGVDQALIVANRLRESVAESLITAGNTAVLATISLGLALCGPCTESLDALLRRADQALYVAKEAGRNQVSFSR